MKLLCKMVAFGLLVTAGSPVVLACAVQAPEPPKVAGCHEHGQKSPRPVTYECCRAGHQVAAVREAVKLREPLAQRFHAVEFSGPVSEESHRVRQSGAGISALSAWDVTSLRI